eukprot:1407254-Pyramimonas_sp.AAC.1
MRLWSLLHSWGHRKPRRDKGGVHLQSCTSRYFSLSNSSSVFWRSSSDATLVLSKSAIRWYADVRAAWVAECASA